MKGLLENKKIIAWGSGLFFQECYLELPLSISYIVDNDSKKWGTSYKGIPIYSPDRLKNEDKSNTIIIIYSLFFQEIKLQIGTLGDYVSIFYGELFEEQFQEKVNLIQYNISDKHIQRNPKSTNAIVVQGLVDEKVTKDVLNYYAVKYPNDYIILSTWETTPTGVLKELELYVDYILLHPILPWNGQGNRNAQIATTFQGILKAAELGAKSVLKTRTDMAVLRENIFDASILLSESFDNKVVQSYGLNSRIIIPQSYTAKYRLYHPCDLAMLGNTEDLLKYWNIPNDDRYYEVTKFRNLNNVSIYEAFEKEMLAESYIAVNFCKNIGRKLQGTLKDSLNFYRDFYIVQDNNWFDLQWFKYKFIHQSKTLYIDHYEWIRLYKKMQIDLVEVDIYKDKISSLPFNISI
ncbi:WavE lipopolysaccharide synthesis family protein [Ornithinibacillus contaminans]|uniref:WavE lipopolysaccharide synthesis family protein n=1 Tax=Ornithinibacillus contaminans TaxID=694055 RepID=UPI00064DB44E|nr:WavE lipopolysaccharide synthesis family protein [Ornithinibacillus contaminans]